MDWVLILVSDVGDEYRGRVVEMLQLEAHRVVFAASAAARAQFLDRVAPGAVIFGASAGSDVPEDLAQAVGVRRTPGALVTDADDSETSRFREVGFHCFDDGEGLALLASWLKTLGS